MIVSLIKEWLLNEKEKQSQRPKRKNLNWSKHLEKK